MRQINVETIKHKDVKGKEQLYVKISAGEKQEEQALINVGEKTFTNIKNVLDKLNEPKEETPKNGGKK